MKKYLFPFIFCVLPIFGFGQLQESHLIDSIFSEWNKPETPGCALGIFKNGQIIYSKGYGMANLEHNIPNSDSTVFRIASISKQFTAACVILLAEKGKLDLDDNLKSFYPDFPEYADHITIRQLLNHTSGIRDYIQLADLMGYGDRDFYDDDDILNWLIKQSSLNFRPGEEYLYSNSGYWLLGQIVSKVAEEKISDFAKKELFEPLGMFNTHFHNDHTQIVKNRASGYVPSNDTYRISMTTLDVIGDGGIFTTINDIKKWDDHFYQSAVLSKEFWREMTRQGILNNGESIDYASGLRLGNYKGLKILRHGGAFVGFRAELLRFPEEQMTIAIFANRADADPTRIAFEIADLLLSENLSKIISKIARPEEVYKLQQLSGDYEIQPGVVVTISVKDDSLHVLQNWNNINYNLLRISGNTFQLPHDKNSSVTFSNLEAGVTKTINISRTGANPIQAIRKVRVDETSINLDNYVGRYYSIDLDVNYNLEINNGKLVARIEDKLPSIQFTSNGIDEFTTKVGQIKFQRDNNQITSFLLDAGRVNNIFFYKQ